MKTFITENTRKVKKTIPLLEEKLNIKISFEGKKFFIKGEEYKEYIADKILRAVDFGFDPEDAIILTNEDFVLEFIDVKKHTRRKNLKEVRARLIGTNGKARKTIEELTGAIIVIQGNDVGLIVHSNHLDAATQAIISIAQGAKHGNVFAYLENQNREMKKFDRDDLGLKKDMEKYDIE